jgi:hypothetical protein
MLQACWHNETPNLNLLLSGKAETMHGGLAQRECLTVSSNSLSLTHSLEAHKAYCTG